MKTLVRISVERCVALILSALTLCQIAYCQDPHELAKERTIRIVETSLAAPESHPEYIGYDPANFRIHNLSSGAFALNGTDISAVYFADGTTLQYMSFPNFRSRWVGVTNETPRLTVQDCQAIAKRVMSLFCANEFQPSIPVVQRLNNDEIAFSCSVSFGGMDFDCVITTMRLDRVSGCLTSLTMGFRNLPKIEMGRLQPRFSEQALFAEGIRAYSSGHALAEGEVTKTQVALCVPDYATIPNEMEPVHYQLVRDDKAAAFYRVWIRGHEASGAPAGRIVWVDAVTGRAVAVRHVDMRGLDLDKIDAELTTTLTWQAAGALSTGESLVRSFRVPQEDGVSVALLGSDGKTLISGLFYGPERLLRIGIGDKSAYYFVPTRLADTLASQIAHPPFGCHEEPPAAGSNGSAFSSR